MMNSLFLSLPGKKALGLLFIVLFSLQMSCFGQSESNTNLHGFSTAKRSDGKGYVMRFHLNHKADSFRVFQPSNNLIQLAIYTSDVDTSKIDVTKLKSPFEQATLTPLPYGIGINIELVDGAYYIAEAYEDFASDDLLLGLTRASQEDIQVLTQGISEINWFAKHNVDTVRTRNDTTAYDTTDFARQGLYSGNQSLPPDSIMNNPALQDSLGLGLGQSSYEKMKEKLKFDVVVIDPGHGGKDPGAIGHNGVKEKDVVLDVAKKLGYYINKHLPEVKVVYTRKDDSFVGLSERGSIANRHEGDLFISLHANAARSNHARGAEVWFLGQHKSQAALDVMKKENSVVKMEEGDNKAKLSDEELMLYQLANSGYMATSQKIAGMLERQFGERARRKSRGVKQAGFMVLYHASMPAILVELGFISNQQELNFLNSEYGHSIMASAIFRTIRNFKEEYGSNEYVKSK